MPSGPAFRFISQRWIVCALCSLGIAIIKYKKICFYAIADIVAVYQEHQTPEYGSDCPFLFSGNIWSKPNVEITLPDIVWNPYLANIEDASFHAGMLLMAIPAGILSDIGFSKYVLIVGMMVVSMTHLIQPMLPRNGIEMKALLNLVEGSAEATLYPSVVSLISRWAPSRERNSYTAVVMTGYFYGEILGDLLFNLIYVETQSWNAGQYITGAIGMAWSCVSIVFIYHSPAESPFISRSELQIMSSGQLTSPSQQMLINLTRIPWREIVYSRAFLSLVLVFCSIDWAAEKHFEDVLRWYQPYILRLPESFCDSSPATARVLSIPALIMGGFLVQWVVNNGLMSKTAIKRGLTFVSLFFSSVLLLLATLVGCNILLFWIFSFVGVFILGLALAVIYCAPVDLDHRYAGILMGMMEVARTICSLFSESIETILVPDFYDTSQWRFRSFVFMFITLILMIPFLFFGSAERQQWRVTRRHIYHRASIHQGEHNDRGK